jgi:hypothetical protein
MPVLEIICNNRVKPDRPVGVSVQIGTLRHVPTAVSSPAATRPDPPGAAPPAPRRWRADLLVLAVAAGLTLWVTGGLWADPNGRAVAVNSSDQALFEWLLAFGAHSVFSGDNPLYTYLINVPDGANLALNTSITVFAVVFAPLTYTIGAPATFLVILTLNLAATAYAWYLFLSRHLVGSTAAAVLGGLFIGFAPGMVSHANAHLNWTAGWLAPLLLWRVFALRTPGRAVRNGLILGALVAVAFSIAAEGLFFVALACGVFLGVWALTPARRAEARAAIRPMLRGLAVTAGVAFVLLSYPLWLHFFGPQRFHGTGFDPRVHAEDIAAYGAFPLRSLAGVAGLDTSLAPNETEENSFFGIPLLVLAIVVFVVLWRRLEPPRRATLLALGLTALVFTVLSWGPGIKIFGWISDVPLPYAVLSAMPIFNAALPARLALVVGPIVGILLAYAVDTLPVRRPAWLAGFALALVPLVPVPLLTVAREPIPAFVTSGAWKAYGTVIAPVPFTLDVLPDGQRWQAYALSHRQGEFAIPSGFFLGPGGPDGRGRIGPVPRATDQLLYDVAQTGVVPPIDDADRAAARADLAYWRVDVVVLADEIHGAKWPVHHDALLAATTQLLGPGERVQDVWLWRLRPGS